MTIDQAKETMLFSFIKIEMQESGANDITREIINSAYQRVVSFYQNEENFNKLKGAVKYILNHEQKTN